MADKNLDQQTDSVADCNNPEPLRFPQKESMENMHIWILKIFALVNQLKLRRDERARYIQHPLLENIGEFPLINAEIYRLIATIVSTLETHYHLVRRLGEFDEDIKEQILQSLQTLENEAVEAQNLLIEMAHKPEEMKVILNELKANVSLLVRTHREREIEENLAHEAQRALALPDMAESLLLIKPVDQAASGEPLEIALNQLLIDQTILCRLAVEAAQKKNADPLPELARIQNIAAVAKMWLRETLGSL